MLLCSAGVVLSPRAGYHPKTHSDRVDRSKTDQILGEDVDDLSLALALLILVWSGHVKGISVGWFDTLESRVRIGL